MSLHMFLKVSCLAWQWMLRLTFEAAEKGALLSQATMIYVYQNTKYYGFHHTRVNPTLPYEGHKL